MRADHFLLGYCDLRIRAAHVSCFLNLCHEQRYIYLPLRDGQKDAYVFRCRLAIAHHLIATCSARGIEVEEVRRGGVPHCAYRYRRRVGLMVGGILAAFLLWLSSSVIWDIRIEGEGALQFGAMREELATCGLSVGSFIPRLDTDAVESRLLTTSQGVAWVSVNVKGTVAYVQLRPLLSPETVDSQGGTVNLVAGCEGVVESVRLMAGDVVVKPGDVVRKGQLLISGVRDIREDGFSLTEARGEVWARTTHTLTVEIPLTYEKKVYTGDKNVKKTLFFFGNEIKVTKSTGIMGGSCDTIRRLETYSLFGNVALPVSMETVEELVYEMQTVTLTPKEAERLAHERLGRALTMATREAMLLSQHTVCQVTDEAVVLRCTYTCVENIAVALPFEAAESESVS
jgi:similar to stage IV sporulation protein